MNKNNYSMRTRLLRLKGWLLTGLILGLFAWSGVAQTTVGDHVADRYLFSSSSGTYTAITGGTVYQSGTAINTDGVSSSITIPSFVYNGTAYTNIFISNNGFITFGATAPLANTYNPISAATAYNGAVAGYGLNLVASGVGTPAPEIRYQDLSGSNTFVIQYTDVARNTLATSDRMNFQIRLNYSTNVISVVYGTFTSTSTTTTAGNFGQTGLRGASNASFHTRMVYGTAPYNTWASSGAAGDDGTTARQTAADNTGGVNTMRFNNTIAPTSGLTYSWTPITSTFYQSLPYTQNFDTWSSVQANSDVPGSTGVITWPSAGNRSWRSVAGTAANAAWNSTTGRFGAPVTKAGASAAQFNQYNAPNGSKGYIDFFLNFSAPGYKVASFSVRNPGAVAANDVLYVYLSTNGGATFTLQGTYAAPVASWTDYSLNLGNGTATNCIVRFEGVSNYSTPTGQDLAIDEFSVVAASCLAPTALTVSAITTTTANLSWTAPAVLPANGYEWEIRTSGAGGSGATGLAASGTTAAGVLTASASGLNPGTNYILYVRSNCGSGDFSAWAGSAGFQTVCSTAALPWSEGFEGLSSVGATVFPNCWLKENGDWASASAATVTQHDPRTGSRYVINAWSATNEFLWTPGFALTAGTAYRFSTFMVTDGVSGWTDVGVYVNSSQSSVGATLVGSAIALPVNTTYSEVARDFTPGVSGTYYFAIRVNATFSPNYIGFDDFSLGELCSGAPTAGAAPSIVPSSACSNGTFSMSLGAGYSTAAGVSYQWQSSTVSASGPWNNITGATNPTYLATDVDVTTYYQCILTCANGGATASSGTVTGTITSLPITITSSIPNFCGTGGSATLTASSGTPYTYTWASLESGTLNTPPTTNPANVTVTSTSGFSVTGFDSGSGCTRVQFYSVGVYNFPSSTMTVDTDTICLGGTVNIGSGLSAAGFAQSVIPFAPLTAPVSAKNLVTNGSTTAPNGIPLSGGNLDDGGWAGIPIGFNFNFFGNSYNTIAVGTNGTLMFGTVPGFGTGSGQLGQWNFTTTPAPFPNVANPGNVVACTMQDKQLGTLGNVRYWTEGYAPNRKFVVAYNAVPEYSGTGTSTAQAIFYETIGTVEIHVTNMSTSTNRVGIVGLQDLTKTIGSTAVSSSALITNSAWRFTPPSNYNTTWSGDGIAAPLSGSNLFTKAATPTTAGTSTYSLVYTNTLTNCSNSATPATINVEVFAPPTAPSVTSPINITGVQNVTITPTYGGPDVLRYWTAATGGTLLGTGPSYTVPYVSASNSVYVETWNGGCNSGSRLLVDIQYTAPTCASIPVGSIVVSNITFANASLAWSNPAVVPASGYEYAVTTSATPPTSGTAAVTNSATATGLSPATVYYVHVRANCGAGDFSTWITSASFTTASVVAPPYATGFAPVPTGWTTTGFTVITSTTPASGNPGAGARVNLYSSVTTANLRSPYVGALVGTENLSFEYSLANWASPYAPPAAGSGNFLVQLSTNGGLTYTTLETVTNNAVAGWQFKTYPLAAYAGQTVTVRILASWVSGDYYLAIDNFEIATPPACPKPYAITVPTVTINSATINATAPNATNGITIEYSTNNFTTIQYAYAASLPYTVTGLAGQTTYQFRLISDCAVDGVSLVSNVGSFTTLPCIPTYTTGKTFGDLISRIEILNTDLSNNSGVAQTNPAYTYFTGLPNYTATLQAGTQYTVEASIGSYGGQGIAAWIDYDDDGLFEASEKIGNTTGTIGSGSGNPGDELLEDHTTQFFISLACNPTPGVHRLRVRCAWLENGEDIDPCATYGYGECEDYDVTISPPPPCPIVSNITFSSVTSTTANASWLVGCAESQWDLAIQTTVGTPTGATNNDVTVNSNYAITGLTPNTPYYVYIQADCLGNGNSSWTGPFTFTTLLPPPANDQCAAAVGLAVNAGLGCTINGTGTLTGATASAGPSAACGDFSDDVWYSFVATYTSHIVTLSNVTPFTTLSFQVLSGSCGSLTALNCNNTSATVSGLTIGQTYYVRVASNGTGSFTSSFNICVTTPPPPPANDDYCNAATLTVGNGCTTTVGTLVSATLSGVANGTCYLGSSNVDVWYKFVAPLAVPANTASVIINTQLLTGGVTDGLMQLYSATGSCPGTLTFTEIDCDDDSGPGLLPSITATGLTSGQTYYVRVHPFDSGSLGSNGVADPNYGKFGICVVNAGAPVPANDNIASAILVPGTSAWYPQCTLYSGDCTLSSNSTQSTGTGPDNWYSFVAASTAVSIDMTSTGLDNAISLVSETSPGVYTVLNSENANFAVGGLERLNYDGLTIGQTYYVSFGAASGTTGGAFQGCIRQLLRSSCNTSVAAPLSNCATFKATWTGANTYTYQFSPSGASIGGGSINATGSISLSNPSLNLVPGNTYNVIINATYNLTNGVGTNETITVFGANPSCANVQIAPHSSIEVRASQRCSAPATLLKTSFLRTDPFVCGVTNYTFEFQAVTDCAGTSTVGLPFTYNNNSRIISLNFPGTQTTPSGQTITPQTYYQVRVRPNFGILGVNQGTFGNPQVIFIGGSVLETEQQLSEMAAEAERMDEESMLDAMIYPNPSNGEVVNLNVANVTSDNVFVRIMDATGRIVYTNRYTVDGSLNTIVTFAQPLANGLYTVEFIMDDQRITERMMIQK